jgi:hypothetical protein
MCPVLTKDLAARYGVINLFISLQDPGTIGLDNSVYEAIEVNIYICWNGCIQKV